MKRSLTVAVVAMALGWAYTSAAQTASAPATMAIRITEARKANAALMRQYSWTSRTEVIDQGQVKDIRIDAVNYGPDGQLQRTVMNDQSAPLPFGFLIRRIAEHERKKVEEYLAGLRGSWATRCPPRARCRIFMNQATATGPDASGLFQITGKSVVFPGDTFSLWVNPHTRHAQRIQVSTTFQGDPGRR